MKWVIEDSMGTILLVYAKAVIEIPDIDLETAILDEQIELSQSMSDSFHFSFFGQRYQKRRNQLSYLFIFYIKNPHSA